MKKIGIMKTFCSKEIKHSYVSIGFETLDRDMFNPEKCYDLLAKTGVKYARCQTGWSKCEKEKGVYDFQWLDKIVDNLLERGIKPWFNVGFGNPLYMDNLPNPTGVGCAPILYGEETYNAWKNYVSALAKHYKDRITHFEIWNEPNNHDFWFPGKADGKMYAQLVKDTGAIIRDIIPNSKIGINTSGAWWYEFITNMLDNLCSNDIDFYAFHTYTTVPELGYESTVEQIRQMFDVRGMQNVEIWQGEGGHPSWAYEGHWLLKDGKTSERDQAVWQLRRYFLDIYNGLKLSSFFQMADMWEKTYEKAVEAIKKPAAHGILNGITYTPKKSFETISYLSALFNGDLKPEKFFSRICFTANDVTELMSVKVMTFRKNGCPICAYYLPSDIKNPKTIEYEVRLEMFGKFDDPILVDMYTGEVFSIEDKIESDYLSKYLKLPLKDYPLVVTEKSLIKLAKEEK